MTRRDESITAFYLPSGFLRKGRVTEKGRNRKDEDRWGLRQGELVVVEGHPRARDQASFRPGLDLTESASLIAESRGSPLAVRVRAREAEPQGGAEARSRNQASLPLWGGGEAQEHSLCIVCLLEGQVRVISLRTVSPALRRQPAPQGALSHESYVQPL